MLRDDSLPSYEQLFGDLDFREGDEARSVYSPAAYLVDLLRLLEGAFEHAELLERRSDLKDVVLDNEHTFTQTAYLDIVNEVLERLIGDHPYDTLRTLKHPFGMPFSLKNEQIKSYLHYLQVEPEALYRLFGADEDVIARLCLGLSPEDVAVVTTPVTTEAALKDYYRLGASETLADLQVVERFRKATALSAAELRELLADGPVTITADELRLVQAGGPVGFDWFERVNRLVRLAKRIPLSLADLSLVLTTCCGGRMDLPALRTIAMAVRLQRAHDLQMSDVCSLAVPKTVPTPPGQTPPGQTTAGQTTAGQTTAGQATAGQVQSTKDLARSIGMSEADIAAVVQRVEPGLFERGQVNPAAYPLLQRFAELVTVFGLSVQELFGVLDAFRSQGDDPFKALKTGEGALALAESLSSVLSWMQEGGFGTQDLNELLGGKAAQADPDEGAVLENLAQAFEGVALAPDLFAAERFGGRAADVIHDVLTGYDDGVVSHRNPDLLRVDRQKAASAAYDAITQLGVVAREDFQGLDLDERLTAKIFANLVFTGYLNADGTLSSSELPLASDFSEFREALFKLIGTLTNGTSSLYPSDLEFMGLDRPDELYDNLIFNGYLDSEGDIQDPGFFQGDDLEGFEVNANLDDVAPAVRDLLKERVRRFQNDELIVDPTIFQDVDAASLLESLRFNGYID